MTRNQPTPFIQAGGQAEAASAFATETQPQFCDVDAAGHDGAGGYDEDDQHEGDHERRLALPDARDQQQARDELDPGERHRDQVRGHGADHLPLVDDLRESRGARNLVEARVGEDRAEEEAEEQVNPGLAEEPPHERGSESIGRPASCQAGSPSFRMAAMKPLSRSFLDTMWLASHPNPLQ